jgi:protein SCO1/2
VRRALAGALTAALVLLSGCGGEATSADGFTGTRLDPPFEVSDVPLTDTSGGEYSLTGSTDKPLTLVFFGYTHCPDICGVVMANLASAMTRLSDADRERVDVVYVTTDPARDTQTVLDRYLEHVDPDFVGLTGNLDDIVALGKPLGVGVTQGKKLPSGGYDVTHGTTITGIDSHDEAPVYWSQETSSAQFAADIHTLLTEGD